MRLLLSLLNLALALALLGGLALTARAVWSRGRVAVFDLVGDGLSKVIAPAVVVPVLELQHRMVRIGVGSASVSVTGDRYLPKSTTIEVSTDDLQRLAGEVEGGLDRVRRDLAAEIGTRALKRGVSLAPGYRVEVFSSPFVRSGRPQVAREVPLPSASAGGGGRSDAVLAMADRAAEHAELVELVERPDWTERPDPEPTRDRGLDDPAAVLDRTTVRPGVMPTRRAAAPTLALTRAASPPVLAETRLLDRCELVDLGGGDPIGLVQRVTTVGRGPSDITLVSDLVSLQHAELVCRSGVWRVRDLDSTNGTWLNGKQVNDAELISGDRVSFGLDGPAFVFARTKAVDHGSE